jgi:hypothetical protein
MKIYTKESEDKRKREMVQKYLTPEELDEYDHINMDLYHLRSKVQNLRALLSRAECQKHRYESLADVHREINEHKNSHYKSISDDEE